MDGQDYVLVTNTSRSAKQVALSAIGSAQAMPVNVTNNYGPAGVAQYPIPLSGALHLDLLDAGWSAVIRPNPKLRVALICTRCRYPCPLTGLITSLK